MHYRLGVFVYRRLFRSLDFVLHKREPSNWVKGAVSSSSSIDGFDGRPAQGTGRQIDALLSSLDRLMKREKDAADRFLEKALVLEKHLARSPANSTMQSLRGVCTSDVTLFHSSNREGEPFYLKCLSIADGFLSLLPQLHWLIFLRLEKCGAGANRFVIDDVRLCHQLSPTPRVARPTSRLRLKSVIARVIIAVFFHHGWQRGCAVTQLELCQHYPLSKSAIEITKPGV